MLSLLLAHATLLGQRQQQETYRILGISVEGNNPKTGSEASAIIGNSGLRVGDQITVPGDQIRSAIQRLWALRIFSDVQILIENKVADGVYLQIKVQEYPRLSRTEIVGADEVSKDDVQKKITLVRGQIITPDDVRKIVTNVKKLYEEEGFLLTEIATETIPDTSDRSNGVVLRLDIHEGPDVRIGTIHFQGNSAIEEGDLKGAMDDTHEKSWWQFWSKPRLDRKKFEADKKRVVEYYRKNGYIDAEVVGDSLWYSDDKKRVNILITVREGEQYKVRNISWEGNTVYPDEVLSARLGFIRGDVFNQEKFDQNLRGNKDQNDVASLYLDNGYLTFNLDPDIQRVTSDSVDINIRVFERNQFTIHKVNIAGNTKTRDYVIRRELYTRPGDYFDRSKIIRSLRQLQQLNYFNPEALKPDYRIIDEKSVDLTYEVEEKSSDNVNASVGYSGAFGVTGALGFTINNFSITDPLGGGAGQVFNFEWQFGEGARFRTFSLSFTEPWLYNTPTTLGVSLFDTRQIYIYDLRQTGVSTRVGRRLRWPDDYFRADWTFRFQNNNVIDNGGNPLIAVGKTTQYSIAQVISRNSTDNPIFPAIGSNIAFSIEMSGGPLLPGNVDYHKWLFNADWYTPLFGSTRLVLALSSSLGYLDAFTKDTRIPPVEYFWMGGTGLGYVATTPLRGYDDRTIGPGRVMSKQSAELRLALTLNPIPIYLLGFTEAGNVFGDFRSADLFDLKRSYGFGARLLINPIGMVGFDYGYGADDVFPKDGKPDGWRFHFQFGRGF
jgi:outer membrane protein insertion porin family